MKIDEMALTRLDMRTYCSGASIIMREKHEMRVNYAWVFLVIFVLTVWLAYEKYISCLF